MIFNNNQEHQIILYTLRIIKVKVKSPAILINEMCLWAPLLEPLEIVAECKTVFFTHPARMPITL